MRLVLPAVLAALASVALALPVARGELGELDQRSTRDVVSESILRREILMREIVRAPGNYLGGFFRRQEEEEDDDDQAAAAPGDYLGGFFRRQEDDVGAAPGDYLGGFF